MNLREAPYTDLLGSRIKMCGETFKHLETSMWANSKYEKMAFIMKQCLALWKELLHRDVMMRLERGESRQEDCWAGRCAELVLSPVVTNLALQRAFKWSGSLPLWLFFCLFSSALTLEWHTQNICSRNHCRAEYQKLGGSGGVGRREEMGKEVGQF